MGPCRFDSTWIEHGPKSLMAALQWRHFLHITVIQLCEKQSQAWKSWNNLRTKLHRKSQQLTTTSPTYCIIYHRIISLYIYIYVCTKLWAWTCTPCRHWNYHYIQSNHAWRAKGVKIWDHFWQHHWIMRGMETKHWPRQPRAFLISSWFRFINWLQRPTAQHPQFHFLLLALQ